MQAAVRETVVGFLQLALAILLFSTIEVGVKLVGPDVPPLRLAAYRFLLGGLILLGPALARLRFRRSPLSASDLGLLALLGLVGVAVSISCYHLALRYLPANVAAILFSANPVFVSLFAPWLARERVSARQVIAIGVGLAGVLVLAFREGLPPAAGILGVAFSVVAQVTFALYSVMSKTFMPRFGARVITCFAGLLGGLMILPVSWALEGAPTLALAPGTWLKVLYLAGGATALAYIAFFSGLERVGASRGAALFFLKPVLASICAWVVIGESLTPSIALGALIILAALFLVVGERGEDVARSATGT